MLSSFSKPEHSKAMLANYQPAEMADKQPKPDTQRFDPKIYYTPSFSGVFDTDRELF